MVTFGRVFVYSLPSSSRACAGGQSNHRNVSVMGLVDSWLVALVAAFLVPLSLLPPPPQAATSAAQAPTGPAETVSLPLIAPPPRGLALLQNPPALRAFHDACKKLRLPSISCQWLWQFLALAIPLSYIRNRVLAPDRCRFAILDPT